jgi:Fe-S cluster biosynthesis and repair protein YggX
MSNVKEIHCTKLGKLAPALKRAPLPGEPGRRILKEISQPAWDQWRARQTMFINENRLNLTEPAARLFLQDQMEAFLFDGEDVMPEGFTTA